MTLRIGIFLSATRFYSGGRIHVYQYALSMALLGAEVWLITDELPPWAGDYPPCERLRTLILGRDPVPPDLDLIVNASKTEIGLQAVAYRDQHPGARLCCFNYETPNWMQEFLPEIVPLMPHTKTWFEQADYVIVNSAESARYLREWLGLPPDHPVGVLPPAANTFALAQAEAWPAPSPDRPYALFCARGVAYKGADVAIEAVLDLPFPLDLYLIGQGAEVAEGSDRHRLYPLEQISDVEKFTLMRSAAVVLAPSLFEGFGMVPAEALCSGTPCVVYDLPVLRQEYGDRLIYARWGDRADFVQKVRHTVERREEIAIDAAEARRTYGLAAMAERAERLRYHAVSPFGDRPTATATG